MHVRVVTDQPWDVDADVLAVPVLDEPAFEGPLGEIDKRSGGELRALADFGELSSKRYSAALVASGELKAGRLLVIGAGEAAELDRETVVRMGAAFERRLGGRNVKRLAVWLPPLADALGTAGRGDAAVTAELLARGVLQGGYEPGSIYRKEVESAPPELDELILVAPDRDKAALQKAAERGVIIAEGANLARTLANRAANDVSPEVLADEAYTIARKNRLWIDVIGPD
ncbi:MAG: hypothetical protein M3067_12100, partial [Chloroflexota bacterium]|nr:hypothetical protein [Chloroflexota bacterium]